MKLFVGSLAWSTTDDSLGALFGLVADVESASVVIDRETGRSRGFGFVEIARRDEAAEAVAALNDAELDGRQITVNVALERRLIEDDWDPLAELETAPHNVLSADELGGLLTTTLAGTPTDELFRRREDGVGATPEVPTELVRVQVVDDRLIEWLAKNPRAMYDLTPRRFEEVCAGMLSRLGFHEVQLTANSADGGIDIFAARRDPTGASMYVVQCKRWSPPKHVGRPELQQLWGVWQDSGATKVVLATTSYFTRPAVQFHSDKRNRMELRDFDGLREWLDACQQQSRAAPP